MLVTTVHQAKGREWDVVIVGFLIGPDLETDRVGRNLAECIVERSCEPEERIGDFDRARLHYVACTRARHLLVLTAGGEPHSRFRSIWDRAARWPDVDHESLARQQFGVAEAERRQATVVIERMDRLVVCAGSTARSLDSGCASKPASPPRPSSRPPHHRCRSGHRRPYRTSVQERPAIIRYYRRSLV